MYVYLFNGTFKAIINELVQNREQKRAEELKGK